MRIRGRNVASRLTNANSLLEELASRERPTEIAHLVVRCGQNIDTSVLCAAWRQTVYRHPHLAGVAAGQDGRPQAGLIPIIGPHDLTVYDWRALPRDAERTAFGEYARDCLKGDRQSSVRLSLFRLGGGQQALIWTVDPMTVDEGSCGLMAQEVAHCYLHHRTDSGGSSIGPIGGVVAEPPHDPARANDLRRLTTASADAMSLCARHTSPIVAGVGQACQEMAFSPSLGYALRNIAKREQIGLHLLCQAAWAVVLSRFYGRSEIAFGATLSLKRRVHGPPSIGQFSRTLPRVVRVDARRPLADIVDQLRAQHRLARQGALLEVLSPSLLDSVVVLRSTSLASVLKTIADAAWQGDVAYCAVSQYPLCARVHLLPDLSIELGYDAHMFDGPTITHLLCLVANVLKGVATDSARPVEGFPGRW